MCCKLPRIPALNKPAQKLCVNCNAGVGCNIYDSRPQTCVEFYCMYMLNAAMGDEWKPSRSKMMVTYEASEERLVVHVDPSRRGAWRSQPFHAQIKKWAANSPRGHVLVWDGHTVIVALADRDIDLGQAKDGQHILIRAKHTAAGKHYEAFLLDHDDPRVKAND